MGGEDLRQRPGIDLQLFRHLDGDPGRPGDPGVPDRAGLREESGLGSGPVDQLALFGEDVLPAAEAEPVLLPLHGEVQREVRVLRIELWLALRLGAGLRGPGRRLSPRRRGRRLPVRRALARIRLVLRRRPDRPVRRAAPVGRGPLVQVPLARLDVDPSIRGQGEEPLALPLRDDSLRDAAVPRELGLAHRPDGAFTLRVHRSPFTGFRTLALENVGAPTTRIDPIAPRVPGRGRGGSVAHRSVRSSRSRLVSVPAAIRRSAIATRRAGRAAVGSTGRTIAVVR